MKDSRSCHSPCLLSISEVAWLLGVDTSRVCRAIRVGTLPVVRRGRRVLVSAHVLAELADDVGRPDDPLPGLAEPGDAR